MANRWIPNLDKMNLQQLEDLVAWVNANCDHPTDQHPISVKQQFFIMDLLKRRRAEEMRNEEKRIHLREVEAASDP